MATPTPLVSAAMPRTLTILTTQNPTPPHTITLPFPPPESFEKIKASILTAHPTRSSLTAALTAAETRLERDLRLARGQKERAEKEIKKIVDEKGLGRTLWRKTVEKLEGPQGEEARRELERRVKKEEKEEAGLRNKMEEAEGWDGT